MAKHRSKRARVAVGVHPPQGDPAPRGAPHGSRDTRDAGREHDKGRTHASPRALIVLVAIVATLAAIAERLSFSRAWGEAESLTSAFYHGDATRFVQYAIAIVQGQPFDNGIPFHPPGWPLALAAYLSAVGVPPAGDVTIPVGAIKLLLACVSGISVGLAALLAYELAGLGAMLAVALLGPFHFGHLVQGAVATSESLYGLAVLGVLLLATRWFRARSRDRAVWAGACGIAGGCAMLVRPEFLAAVVVLGVVAITRTAEAGRLPGAWKRLLALRTVRARDDRSRVLARELLFFVLCLAAVMLPTTVWHWRTLSAFDATHVGTVAGPLPRLAPVTSYGPFNFAMANHELAEGGPNSDHPLLEECDAEHENALGAGQLDLACPAIYDLYVNGYRIGAGWLLTHPADALALMHRKIGMAIGFLAHGYLVDDVGVGVNGERRRVDMLDPEVRWLLPVHFLLLVVGVGVLRRPAFARGLLAAPLVALVASTLLFYGYVRQGAAYAPVVWVWQGAALGYVAARLAPGVRPRTAVAIVLVAVAVLVAVDGVRAPRPRAVALDGLRDASGALVQDETVQVRRAR